MPVHIQQPSRALHVRFREPRWYFTYTGTDYKSGDRGIGNCSPDHTLVIVCQFEFIGQADGVTQTETYRNTAIRPTVVVPFPNAPVKSIVPGSIARCTAIADPYELEDSYALVPNTPIPPIETSTVVVVGTSALTTTSMLSYIIGMAYKAS
jgi:hypothetical protein